MSNAYQRVAVSKNHSNIQMLIGSDKVSHQLDGPEMKSVKVNLLSTFPISGLPAGTFCSLSMGYDMLCLCFCFLNFRIGLLVIRKKNAQQWEIMVEFHFLRTRHLNDPNDHASYYFNNTESFFIPPLKKKNKRPLPRN